MGHRFFENDIDAGPSFVFFARDIPQVLTADLTGINLGDDDSLYSARITASNTVEPLSLLCELTVPLTSG